MDKSPHTLEWTTEPPKEPGWYWFNLAGFESTSSEVRYVGKRPGHEYLAVQINSDSRRVYCEVGRIPGAIWAGPIPEPTGNSG